ncbi:RNA-directed DNA polymerase from mobile element jockey [Eumeta japonica]|uniref:RNA-directed DNA polymerase from mobile element jockey n=1 Tax=Eumeta variegata TaxID=151549 RepID=A0A4C1X6R6_EUMVA|nr:RNA-directed DNA polymerase from mobile element jockey [Eumeta japonica]
MDTAPPPLPEDLFYPNRAIQDSDAPLQKQGLRTGWHINSRAEASTQKGNCGHELSLQRNTPHWSLSGGVEKGENYNDTKSGKDPRKPENIRSITLLFHVARTFERIPQLIRVLHHLASERNYERYTVAVLLVMEKAFDRVWHDGLVHKLLDISLSPALTKAVASFFQRRSFCVAVDDVLSAPHPIRARVPQGSCLSPELYALYTDDIPKLRGNLKDWEDDVMLALYAGDSAYFLSSRRADLVAKRILKDDRQCQQDGRSIDRQPT